MNERTYLSTYWSEDGHNRKAVLGKDRYHYIVECWERGSVVKTELFDRSSVKCNEAEDAADKWVRQDIAGGGTSFEGCNKNTVVCYDNEPRSKDTAADKWVRQD